MDDRQRVVVAGMLMVGAGVFGGLPVAVQPVFAKNSFLLFSLTLMVIAMWLVAGPNYAPKRSKNPAFFVAFIPICKAKFRSVWDICYRCLGFYIGFACSVLMLWTADGNFLIQSYLQSLSPEWLIVLAFLLITPTAIHGSIRRLGDANFLPHPAWRIVTGFLAGIAFYVAQLACHLLFD